MKYRTILFDFDGVLCKGRFYEKNLLPDYAEVYRWIRENIFENKELVGGWMRNQIGSDEINKLIAKNTGIGCKKLKVLYEESVRGLKLEKDVVALVKSLRQGGQKVGIVTDNMDVFTRIIVPNQQLETLFDVVVNSADHGILKRDNQGKLFDITLAILGENIKNSLMIDDSASVVELCQQKGGQGFLYKDVAELKSFL